ncbi:MAG: glycosyltransferase family 4 protein [Candidatus Aminicenantes bacterium]|nr:glycosyltransferase family 4 protein [Candidatus Aminicenantes bacterium]
MKILLDGHFLDKKKEGSRTVIYSYLEGLAKIAGLDARFLDAFSFVVPVFQPEYWQKHFAGLGSVRFIRTSRNAILRNQIDFPRRAAGLHADVLQSVYYLPLLSPKSLKKVLVIHDLLPFSHPQYFPKYFRFKFKKMVRLSQQRADCIVCGSAYSKAAIQDVFQIEDSRLRVIPYGINVDRYAAGPTDRVADGFDAGFPKAPFILVVGRLDPRKGLRLVLDLFEKLRLDMDIRLVLVGGSDALPATEMRLIVSLQAAGLLHWFQNISDEMLTCLYRRARLLLFLPAVEGFGLPVLEAMAAGLPYLTIPRGGLKEITIKEAWVDVQDPQQMVRQAAQLLFDEKQREHFVQKGHEQVQKFRCEEMVRQYLCLYQQW